MPKKKKNKHSMKFPSILSKKQRAQLEPVPGKGLFGPPKMLVNPHGKATPILRVNHNKDVSDE